MNLFAFAKNFAADESGAVTVDWVVLTAAIVGLGIAVLGTVTRGVENVATDIEATMINDVDSSPAPFTSTAGS